MAQSNPKPRFQVNGPDAEVLGQAMLAFVESINFGEFQDILSRQGLTHINPEQWYPQQIWLDVFNEITTETNASSNLVSIGMKVIDTAIFPPGVDDLPFTEKLGLIREGYRLNNRGKDIGKIEMEIVSDHHVIMHDSTPYPDDFIYGAYYALAKRFLPRGKSFTVKFDPDVKPRDQGGKATLVHITWG